MDKKFLELINNYSKKEITYALYGFVLGDGYYSNGRLIMIHTNKQRNYCVWMETIFKAWGLKTSSRYDYYKNTTFGDYKYSHVAVFVPKKFYFETEDRWFDPLFSEQLDYILYHINPLGLLFWYLDDGCLSVRFQGQNRTSRFAYLNTQGFSLEENQKIKRMFKERFDIDVAIHKDSSGFEKYKDKVYYRIYFNAKNFRKFFDIVKVYLPYIPNDMKYKFDLQYKVNRLKDSLALSENYNIYNLK